jgi:hypothetical protein
LISSMRSRQSIIQRDHPELWLMIDSPQKLLSSLVAVRIAAKMEIRSLILMKVERCSN